MLAGRAGVVAGALGGALAAADAQADSEPADEGEPAGPVAAQADLGDAVALRRNPGDWEVARSVVVGAEGRDEASLVAAAGFVPRAADAWVGGIRHRPQSEYG